MMCDLLDWRLQAATNLDIVEFFISQGFLFEDDLVNDETPNENRGEMAQRIEKEAFFLANKVLRDPETYKRDPLELAATCLAYIRKINWISPIWFLLLIISGEVNSRPLPMFRKKEL